MTAGSNELGWIADIASDYKNAISADEPSIDEIYCYGLWLGNSYFSLKAKIANGDWEEPEPAASAAAAINTVIAIHGTMIASLERGQVLMAREEDFAKSQADVAAFKLWAQEFAIAVKAASKAVTPEAQKVIAQANANIAEGEHPDRATEIARTGNSNFLTAAGKLIAVAAAEGVKAGVKTSVAGLVVGTTGGVSIALLSFFSSNLSLLREVRTIRGFKIPWLDSFLDWIERNQDKPSE